MFNLLARKSLNLVMTVSLLIGSTGSHQKPSALGAASSGLTTPLTLQMDFGIQFAYDPNGNIASRTDANGATTKYEYDADNHLIAIRYPDKTSVKFTYDALGRRTQMMDPFGKTSYEYNIHGQLTMITDPDRNILKYNYDPRGLISQLIYPDGSIVKYTWDANRQLSAVQDASSITSYKYDLGGKLTDRILPNGVITHYEYDNANRLTALQHTDPGGGLLQGYKYQFDALGNRTQMTQIEPTGNQVTNYRYDALNRLEEVTNPNGEKLTYRYDAIGNLASMTSSKFGMTRYTYNGLGQLAELKGPQEQIRLNYDANGNLQNSINMLSKNTINYNWDFENRLVSLDNGATNVKYGYNGIGSLISKSSAGITSSFLPDPLSSTGSIMAEYDQPGKIDSIYLYGNTLIGARASNSSSRFYLEGGIDSFGQGVDSRGSLIDAQNYSAYSEKLSFAARELEGEALQTAVESVRDALRDVALDGIPVAENIGTAQTIWTLISYSRALWFTNHASGNLPRWLTGPDGPDALRVTPASHLVLAWDLLKGPINSPFKEKIIPINNFSDDGFHRIQTTGFQKIQETYFSSAAGPAAMRDYGYDPLTDTFTKTIHTETITTETTGYNQSAWTFQTLQSTPGNPQIGVQAGNSSQGNSMMENFPLPVENNSIWPDIKRVPFFFPPDWPNGGGGGAAVGGVLLDKAAQMLVNLNDITGASFDPKTGQVILIGRQDSSLNLPPMSMDDLVVAIRSVYAGVDPGVTMVPIDPTMKNIKQRVEYFGPRSASKTGCAWI
jgi:YD repeat-containing protein